MSRLNKLNTLVGVILIVSLFFSNELSAKNKIKEVYYPYKDSTLSVKKRVENLLSLMTLEEKMWQLNMNNLNMVRVGKDGKVTRGSLDSLFHGMSIGLLESPFEEHHKIALYSEAVDDYLRNHTRLGIPAIQIAECIHGQMALNTTIFPQSIAQGSTWNPNLILEMAEVIAEEAKESGVDQAFSPLFDLARDARYGRVEECFGEDPFLVKEMGVAFVKGMQGEPEITKNGLLKGKVACTAKHFVAYSVPDGGINLGPVNIGERNLRELYLYPFEGAVKEANIYSVMPGYHEIDGLPVHADSWLLRDVLRGEWKFKGVVVSDAMAISMLEFFHKVAKDSDDAGRIALTSGVDVEVSTPITYRRLDKQVESGVIDEAILDSAVANVLRNKFKMGLFERPYKNPYRKNKTNPLVHNKRNIELAERVAQESVVLLQNKNSVLPLNKSTLKSLAVIGPNANNVQFGDYSVTKNNNYGVTTYNGLKSLLGESVKLEYREGCGVMSLSKEGFPAAIEAAKNSDAIVLVLGGTSIIYSGIGWGDQNSTQPNTCGEGFDRNEISLPGVQSELLEEISKLGKPIVLVLVNGRPYTIEREVEMVDAVVEAWYPGEQGGKAVSDILLGNVNPSGKLSISFPRSTGHIPTASIYKPSSRGFYKSPGTKERSGRDYVNSSPTPLFCFGHGLSYTEFKYSDLVIEQPKADFDSLSVKLTVTNIGNYDGAEVVQCYVRDVLSSITTPMSSLKAFNKVFIRKGESKEVELKVSKSDLMFWNRDIKRVFESGEFEFYIGSSQNDIRLKKSINLAH